jgi:hypothetical protein
MGDSVTADVKKVSARLFAVLMFGHEGVTVKREANERIGGRRAQHREAQVGGTQLLSALAAGRG